jgi:RNA polymerase sigma-70 factor (ECF subfamily)
MQLNELVALIPKLRAYAISLSRSAADADDLVQDTLLRAWRFRESFAEGTNLKAWLFRILRNEFLTRISAARNTVQDVDGAWAASLSCAAEQDLNLRYQELLNGMQRLSHETREALVLTLGAGFTYHEAADACGCPVGTMKSRVNRARRFLVDHIEA